MRCSPATRSRSRHAGVGCRRAEIAGDSRRWRHRLEPRVEDQPLGKAAGRRSRLPGAGDVDDAAPDAAQHVRQLVRRSRSTATSAAARASPRCSCRATTAEIELLPALPKAWPTGSVKGLRARGGFEVDIAWKDGKVVSYRVASAQPREVKIRIHREVKVIQSEKS